jgi:DNA-directed RNA polymerase specialized sigma24 family protein
MSDREQYDYIRRQVGLGMKTPDQDHIDEVTQAVVLKLVRTRSWGQRITAKAVQRFARQVLADERRRRLTHLSSLADRGESAPAAPAEPPDGEIDEVIERYCPGRGGEVLRRALLGMSPAEIAADLGLPGGTVRRLLHQARKAVRPLLV